MAAPRLLLVTTEIVCLFGAVFAEREDLTECPKTAADQDFGWCGAEKKCPGFPGGTCDTGKEKCVCETCFFQKKDFIACAKNAPAYDCMAGKGKKEKKTANPRGKFMRMTIGEGMLKKMGKMTNLIGEAMKVLKARKHIGGTIKGMYYNFSIRELDVSVDSESQVGLIAADDKLSVNLKGMSLKVDMDVTVKVSILDIMTRVELDIVGGSLQAGVQLHPLRLLSFDMNPGKLNKMYCGKEYEEMDLVTALAGGGGAATIAIPQPSLLQIDASGSQMEKVMEKIKKFVTAIAKAVSSDIMDVGKRRVARYVKGQDLKPDKMMTDVPGLLSSAVIDVVNAHLCNGLSATISTKDLLPLRMALPMVGREGNHLVLDRVDLDWEMDAGGLSFYVGAEVSIEDTTNKTVFTIDSAKDAKEWGDEATYHQTIPTMTAGKAFPGTLGMFSQGLHDWFPTSMWSLLGAAKLLGPVMGGMPATDYPGLSMDTNLVGMIWNDIKDKVHATTNVPLKGKLHPRRPTTKSPTFTFRNNQAGIHLGANLSVTKFDATNETQCLEKPMGDKGLELIMGLKTTDKGVIVPSIPVTDTDFWAVRIAKETVNARFEKAELTLASIAEWAREPMNLPEELVTIVQKMHLLPSIKVNEMIMDFTMSTKPDPEWNALVEPLQKLLASMLNKLLKTVLEQSVDTIVALV